MSDLFDSLDRDHNGVLTKQGVIASAGLLSMTKAEAAVLFNRLDTDGSGKLTRSAFESLVQGLENFGSSKLAGIVTTLAAPGQLLSQLPMSEDRVAAAAAAAGDSWGASPGGGVARAPPRASASASRSTGTASGRGASSPRGGANGEEAGVGVLRAKRRVMASGGGGSSSSLLGAQPHKGKKPSAVHEPGTRVVVGDCEEHPDLKGMLGVVRVFSPATGRYSVDLDNGHTQNITFAAVDRPTRITVEVEPGRKCGVECGEGGIVTFVDPDGPVGATGVVSAAAGRRKEWVSTTTAVGLGGKRVGYGVLKLDPLADPPAAAGSERSAGVWRLTRVAGKAVSELVSGEGVDGILEEARASGEPYTASFAVVPTPAAPTLKATGKAAEHRPVPSLDRYL